MADEPQRLIDNHPDVPNAALAKRSVETIYRSNRTRRMIGRWKRRWKIERLNSWLPDYCRVNERKVENYIGFGLPLLRRYLG